MLGSDLLCEDKSAATVEEFYSCISFGFDTEWQFTSGMSFGLLWNPVVSAVCLHAVTIGLWSCSSSWVGLNLRERVSVDVWERVFHFFLSFDDTHDVTMRMT